MRRSDPGDDIGDVMFHREGGSVRYELRLAIIDPLDPAEELAQQPDELHFAEMHVVKAVGRLALDLVGKDCKPARPDEATQLIERRLDVAGVIEDVKSEDSIVRAAGEEGALEHAVDSACQRRET